MKTKEPEFDLEKEARVYLDNVIQSKYQQQLGFSIPQVIPEYLEITAFKAGYHKGREVERKDVLEEVRGALYLDPHVSWDDQEQIEKILNRLGGEK